MSEQMLTGAALRGLYEKAGSEIEATNNPQVQMEVAKLTLRLTERIILESDRRQGSPTVAELALHETDSGADLSLSR